MMSVRAVRRWRRTPTWPTGWSPRRVEATRAKITAKRLLPEARAVGYVGSARNFRRLVASEKKKWRARNGRQRRPAVWTPGDVLVIDWGTLPGTGIHVLCAVLAWSRVPVRSLRP
jgi:hypothetical protein